MRQLSARSRPQYEALARFEGILFPRNRIVRSLILAGIYAGAFFPMSSLPGAAAQFVSIVPLAIIASWLGFRGAVVAGLGFIPLLVILTVAAQGETWDYMLHEGRPAALVSLIGMAAVAGRASDLARRLAAQTLKGDGYVERIERLARDRARLIQLGIELAEVHTPDDVYRISSAAVREWLEPDRIAFVELDRDTDVVEIKYFEGMQLPGFEAGQRFEIDSTWQNEMLTDAGSNREPERTLPGERLETWRSAGFKSVLRVPLVTDGDITGYLAVSSLDDDAFGELEASLLEQEAQHIQPHLAAAFLFDANTRAVEIRKAQSEVARAISMNTGLDSLLQVAGMQLEALLDFEVGFIAENEQGESKLAIRHSFGRRADLVQHGTLFEWDPDFAYLDDEVRFWNLSEFEIGDGAFPFSTFASEGLEAVGMITLMTEGEPVGWMVLAGAGRCPKDDLNAQLLQAVSAHLANGMVRGRVEAEQKRLLKRLAAQNNELRSARKHLQETQAEVEKQNGELQKANEAKNTFLSAVSHELKTPLAIMVGFAELLGMNVPGNLNEQQLQQLGMVERNGRHLDLLVSDLVDVSRIESGRLAVNLAPTDPEEVLNEILTDLDSIVSEKQQRLVRNFDLEGRWVRADRARLGQVVTNLVTNACKYSPENTDVTVSARIDGHEVEVKVADQGMGIAEEDQKKLFTPFFRSSNEEAIKEKGTGLGLVITRSIVEMHGGTLDLASKLGEGTTITVRMPGVMTEYEAASASDTEETGDAA